MTGRLQVRRNVNLRLQTSTMETRKVLADIAVMRGYGKNKPDEDRDGVCDGLDER